MSSWAHMSTGNLNIVSDSTVIIQSPLLLQWLKVCLGILNNYSEIFFCLLFSPKVPHVLVRSGANNSQVSYKCWAVFIQPYFWFVVDQGLVTKASIIAIPEEACSTSSRVMSFTLNMFCRMWLTSSCFLSGWCPLSRQAVLLIRRIPHATRC